MTKPVEVTQADRDAAARYIKAWQGTSSNGPIREPEAIAACLLGELDNHELVQAFASHRIASTRQLEAKNERIEQQSWEGAREIVRGTNADMCKTAQQAYRIIHKAINDAVNNPKLRTLQGRVEALQETGDVG